MLNARFFEDFERFARSMDRLFDSVGDADRWTRDVESDQLYFTPPVETGRTSESLNLRFILPGVTEKDIEVTVQGNQLILRGERKAPEGFGDQNATCYRLPYGRFERLVDLPNGLNTDGLEAHLHDGVMDIRVPVAEEMKPKRIEVAAGKSRAALAA